MGNRDYSAICPERGVEKGLEGVDICDEAAYHENTVGRSTPHRGMACAKVLWWERAWLCEEQKGECLLRDSCLGDSRAVKEDGLVVPGSGQESACTRRCQLHAQLFTQLPNNHIMSFIIIIILAST